MAKFKVTAPDGRQVVLTSQDDTPPSEQELEQVFSSLPQKQAPVQDSEQLGIEGGKLSGMERMSGGFRSPQDLQQRRDTQRQAMGVAEGEPLEPTGINMQNLMDLPNDVLDMVGPAFPAIGQLFAGLGTAAITKNPAAVVAASGAASAGGEYVRQEVGKQLFGFDQGPALDRASRAAIEGGIGLTGEAAALGINQAIRSTKVGLLHAANKLFRQKSVDQAMGIWGQLAPDIDPLKTQYALDQFRKGNTQVLSRRVADDRFALEHSEKVLFGGPQGNITDHIIDLGRKANPESVAALMQQFLNVPEETTKRIMRMGGNIPPAYKNPKTIEKIMENTSLKLNRAKTLEMDRFASALDTSMTKYGEKTVPLTDINEQFIKDLKNVGVLNPNNEISETFAKSNPKIANLAKDFLNDFASNQRLRGGQLKITSVDELKRLANTKTLSDTYSADRTMKLKDLSKAWKTRKNSITTDIFETSDPKVNYPFARYFDKVAERMGRIGRMEKSNQRYRAFMEVYRPLEDITKSRPAFNGFLSNLNDQQIVATGINRLESMMPANLNFSNDVLGFNAVQSLIPLDQPVARAMGAKSLTTYMDSVFNNSSQARSMNKLVEQVIDPGLPRNLRIQDTAKLHTTAKALNKSTISLLRARFLANAGGATSALAFLGPIGGAAAIGSGIVMQNPKLFAKVLQGAAKLPVGQGVQSPVGSAVGRAGPSPLLAQLLSGSQRVYQNNQSQQE